jgi:hypothetical protein
VLRGSLEFLLTCVNAELAWAKTEKIINEKNVLATIFITLIATILSALAPRRLE